MYKLRDLELAEERLASFTRAYHEALEATLEATGRGCFPHHGERAKYVHIIKAQDGLVAFYLPASPDPSLREGYYLYDWSRHTLNDICQSLSVQRLRVASARLGQPWDSFDTMPREAATIPEIAAPWIHDDVRALAVAGKLTSLPGMTISPIIKIEGGVRRAVEPARVKLWSPTFEFPGIGVRRLFLWTHADFWWYPEELDLDPSGARDVAAQDVLALKTVLASVPTFTPHFAQQDTPRHAAGILEGFCDELLDLLLESGSQEERLHQWLNEPHHHVFLDPDHNQVWSKLPFGDKVSDFVVLRSDGRYLLIEIEPATQRIFRQDNAEPTAQFNHACQQVYDWQRYVRENVRTVRDELGLADIYEPGGMVVAGRRADIDSDAARLRWRDMKGTHRLALYTYDDLSDRVRSLAASLRAILQVATPSNPHE